MWLMISDLNDRLWILLKICPDISDGSWCIVSSIHGHDNDGIIILDTYLKAKINSYYIE